MDQILWRILAAWLIAMGGWAVAQDAPLRLGDSRIDVSFGPIEFDIYTHRPLNCAQPSVLLVFHGNGRGASSYRDSARPVAKEACFVVYSPLFDKKRFPNWSYHRGGLIEDGALRDSDDWTVAHVSEIVEWIQEREGPDTPVYLFGHSAGAQYLSRVVAFAPPAGVSRVVLANPSTYVVPSNDWDVPYGFGGLGADLAGKAAIRAYLEAPVTIYLGQDDIREQDVTRNEDADRLGENRLERGRYVYRYAREMAEKNGWTLNWTLVEAPGVGHTARGMLGAPELIEALGLAGAGASN